MNTETRISLGLMPITIGQLYDLACNELTVGKLNKSGGMQVLFSWIQLEKAKHGSYYIPEPSDYIRRLIKEYLNVNLIYQN